MAGNIIFIAEQWQGQLSDTAFELQALGSELASALGVELHAVLLGNEVRDLAYSLGKTRKVHIFDSPWLGDPVPELYARALCEVVRAESPRCVFVPMTNLSMEIGPLAAVHLGLPYVNCCTNIRAEDGAVFASCLLYGGKMQAEVKLQQPVTVIGIMSGSRPAEREPAPEVPELVMHDLTVSEEGKVRFDSYLEPEVGDVDITQQEVLVAVGRGIQNQDNISLAEELAEALGGAVCGSRPVIDQGWLPLSRQVGKSGKSVKPKLYLALGISGAPEHVEGMKGADTIIAINTDPAAPIFDIAHYGVVADVFDIIPALSEQIAARRKG